MRDPRNRRRVDGTGRRHSAQPSLLVVALVLMVTTLTSTTGTAFAADVRSKEVEGFARLGDCAQPTEGVTCHFVSVGARARFVQLELTTVELQDGREVYSSDILCNVDRARVVVDAAAGRVAYRAPIPAEDCEFLMGEAPAPIDLDIEWTAMQPLEVGTNPCAVTATIDGVEPLTTIFCDLLVTQRSRRKSASG